jgi:ABC-type Na+ efflux pump permease subunit
MSVSPSLMRSTLLVARKELVASFRDRQTTLYAIVLPIVLYPFLFWAMIQGSLFLQGRREHTEVRIGLAALDRTSVPDGLVSALSKDVADSPKPASRQRHSGGDPGSKPASDGDHVWEPVPDADHSPEPVSDQGDTTSNAESRREEINRMLVVPLPRTVDERGAKAWLRPPGDTKFGSKTEHERPDAVLWLAGSARPPAGDTISDPREARARLFYDSTESRSTIARSRVEKRLPAFAEKLRDERAQELAKDPKELVPFQLDEPRDIAQDEGRGAYMLSFLLPMLLVVMTVMGALYPAVDLTAGERERSTAETTLLLPVPRMAVHQGKILAVCAAAVLATALNLLALGLSAGHLLSMMRSGESIEIHLPVEAFAAIAPLALLFAFFVSAVLTGIAAFARTFKEGQALLGPVMMLFVLPAMAGAIPGLELTPRLCCVPVLNVVLAFRGLLKGQSMPLEYSLTAIVLLVYALLGIAIAVRVLSREALVSGERSFALKDFFRIWRSQGSVR